MDSKISFMTFASSNWTAAPARFKRDLRVIRDKFGFFDREFVLDERDLGAGYLDRFSRYAGDHGYAYWSWKPYAIAQTLRALDPDEWLLYLDAGCVLPMGRLDAFLGELRTVVGRAHTSGSLLTLTTCGTKLRHVPDGYIVRRSIAEAFGLQDDKTFLFKFPHWQAGLILARNNYDTLSFFDRWYAFFLDNYESRIRGGFRDRRGEMPGWRHNGGDQAVMQCMIYKDGVPVDDGLNFMYHYGVVARRRG